jgi:hypothetical protein
MYMHMYMCSVGVRSIVRWFNCVVFHS